MHTTTPSVFLLWDESHLWGILLHRALQALGVPTRCVKAKHIRAGLLNDEQPELLLVPGGWATRKSLALGNSGRAHVRDYVRRGGTYLGFCGGAGLALASERNAPLLDLCPWTRKPAKERLPNFSGHLHCQVQAAQGFREELLPVWWPSQFAPDPNAPLEILARYERPGPDFWAADVEWSEVNAEEIPLWEELYGINLDPERLRDEPCIVRGQYGQGTFILSYSHLETPDSPQANALLSRLLGLRATATVPVWDLSRTAPLWPDNILRHMHETLSDLVRFGQNHFLLSWRTPWMLGWRRGVPGSPLAFLLAMVWQARHSPAPATAHAHWAAHGERLLAVCLDFCRQVRRYLLTERRILATSPSSPEASACPDLQRHKELLFGKFPGYGGLYGTLLQDLDELLWLQLTVQDARPEPI